MGDRRTKEQRHGICKLSGVLRSKIETILARALWARGYRYRKNSRSVPGKPDISMKRLKIAIFVDGEFWHGKDWEVRQNWLKSNQEFWKDKIERNIRRDEDVNDLLKSLGWYVLRFWGEDIKKDLDVCLAKIDKAAKQAAIRIKKRKM